MFNSERPAREDLPSSAQLLKSTVIAIITAIAILITIVLPAEYAIDPTGVGRMLQLTEMGEIKQQLAEEAEKDHQQEEQKAPSGNTSGSLFNGIFAMFIGSAQAQSSTAGWTDEISYTLQPGQGIEVKLAMEEGGEVEFKWVAEGGKLNYDLHGDASGEETSYKKGRGMPGDEGVLKAGFTGKHGWFWRNRDKQDVKVTLFVRGAYSDVIRPKQ